MWSVNLPRIIWKALFKVLLAGRIFVYRSEFNWEVYIRESLSFAFYKFHKTYQIQKHTHQQLR
jgi:hypothetical protein